MSRFTVQWDLTVTAASADDYALCVQKVRSNAARRLADFQEVWTIAEQPEALRVQATVVSAVDDLDAAG